MAAIAGIIHFDGAPVDPQDLQRMSQALQPFGRDGERIVERGSYGFVARYTQITLEDKLDQQPISMGNKQWLLFKGRIDNRPHLIKQLGLDDDEGRMLADSAIAARIWAKYGKNACSEIIGYFALVHWCSETEKLCLIRSAPQGEAILVHRHNHCLYFSTVPHALFALPQIPRKLSETGLADVFFQNPSQGETLYEGISQVLNAQLVEYGLKSTICTRYWSPDCHPDLTFKREEEAWEAFGPILEDVVNNQLRSIYPVGVMMSGGLDSAAIASQAATILRGTGQSLLGYTLIPSPEHPVNDRGLAYTDETARVRAIIAMHPNINPNFLHAGREPIVEGMLSAFPYSYFSWNISPTLSTADQVVYRKVSTDGVRVLLHGGFGNDTFSYHGYPRFRELFYGGNWGTLFQELFALQKFQQKNLLRISWQQLIRYFIPECFANLIDRGNVVAGVSRYIAPSFAQESGALERAYAYASQLRQARRQGKSWRTVVLTKTSFGKSVDQQSQYGIEMRWPLLDRRIVEFCLALPNAFYLKDGIERRFARKGMKHLIPASIAMDPRRGCQDVDWEARIKMDSSAIDHAMTELFNEPSLAKYMDIIAIQKTWNAAHNVGRFDDISAAMGALRMGHYIMWFNSGKLT